MRLSMVRRGKLFLLLLVKISNGCRQQVDYMLTQINSHQCTLQQCLITQPVCNTSLGWPTHTVKSHQGLLWNLKMMKPRSSRTLREPSLISLYTALANTYYHLWLIWVYPFFFKFFDTETQVDTTIHIWHIKLPQSPRNINYWSCTC